MFTLSLSRLFLKEFLQWQKDKQILSGLFMSEGEVFRCYFHGMLFA